MPDIPLQSPPTLSALSRPATWSDWGTAVLHHDFCPQFNRWVYWMKRPEASLVLGGITSLACGVFVQPLALIPFSAILLTLILGWIWPWIAMRGLDCELRFLQSRVTEGEPVQVQLTLRNRYPWSVWGLSIEGGLIRDLAGTPTTAVALARLAGWSRMEFIWEFRPACRGVYPFSDPRLVTGFPFGLKRFTKTVEVQSNLIVWPRVIPLEVLLDSSDNHSSEEFFCDHRVGDSGDLLGTRPFRQGDSLRRVHWSQTARHGSLVVCERQASAQTAVRMVLDLSPETHAPSGDDGTLEWGIRFAASIAACYRQQHARVECRFGERSVTLSGGENNWRKFLDELARIPCDGVALKNGVLEGVTAKVQSEALSFVITTDQRLIKQPELSHPGPQHRFLVMKTEGWGLRRTADVHFCTAHHWLVIDFDSQVADQFRMKWRRMCHEH